MKNLLFILVTVLALVSCNKTEYVMVIPSNATFVGSVNIATLAEKGDLGQSFVSELVQNNLSLVFSGESEAKMKAYLESPQDMGIDLRMPIYVFQTINKCIGVTMKLHDKDDFEEFLCMLVKQNLASKAVERDGVMIGTFLEDVQYGYDGGKLLLLASMGENGGAAKQTLAELFRQEFSDSFASTDDFTLLSSKSNCDMNFCTNISVLPEEYALRLKSFIPSGIRSTDIQLFSFVTFENGKAVVSSKIVGINERAKKMLKEAECRFRTIKGRYINMPTDRFFLWGCMGVDGEWLLSSLKQDNDAKQALFMMERGIDIEAMIKAMDGDLAIMLPEATITSNILKSDFMICAQIKNSDFLDDVEYWKKGMKDYGISMEKTSKDEYLLVTPDFKVNWGVNGNDLFIGTSETYSAMAKSSKSSVLANYNSEISSSMAFVYINLKSLPINDLGMIFGTNEISNRIAKLKSVIYCAKSACEMELRIEIDDDKENFLKAMM